MTRNWVSASFSRPIFVILLSNIWQTERDKKERWVLRKREITLQEAFSPPYWSSLLKEGILMAGGGVSLSVFVTFVLCYIYHGLTWTCKYVCEPGDRKAYGKGQCRGRDTSKGSEDKAPQSGMKLQTLEYGGENELVSLSHHHHQHHTNVCKIPRIGGVISLLVLTNTFCT